MITDSFDLSESGIINPQKIISPIENFPEISIGIFSRDIVSTLAEQYHALQIAEISTASVCQPIYKLTIDGTEIALHAPLVGAPTASASLEEISAMGAKYFVFGGMCGVLRHDIADGHLIVPDCAVRDEGFSYHYCKPAHEIKLNKTTVALTERVLAALNLPYITGKVWTTDAFYRETPSKIALRKKENCICVDMECSALAAVAEYRNLPFAQFFFAADNLDSSEWEQRELHKRGKNKTDIYITAAIEIGKALRKHFQK